MIDLLAAFTWAPGFKGFLTVAVAVIILIGSVTLILATNGGARLGFLTALTGLMGWFVVMGLVWSMYGIGYKGPAPTWKVVDVNTAEPAKSDVEVADSLPLPGDGTLPEAAEAREANPDLVAAFPEDQRAPTLGDLITIDTDLADSINDEVAPWKILATSNKYTGELQSVVSEHLGPNGTNTFPNSAAGYVVIDSFVTGGKKGRTDNSIIGRIKYKFTSAVEFDNPDFMAAVQLQPVVPQVTKDGQAPPTPVADKSAPIYTIILERDRGALRLPSISFTIFSSIMFAICASALHRRDKLVQVQRAAVAGAGA